MDSGEWVRPRPDARGLRADALVALALLLGASVSALLHHRIGYYDEPAPLWASALALTGLTLPLALRRRAPELVAIIVSASFFVIGQFAVPELLVSNIALFLAIYSVGAWSRSRRRAHLVRILIVLAMFAWVGVNLTVTAMNPELLPDLARSGVFSQLASFALLQLITNALYFGGAYYFGDVAWSRARERHELESRTRELAEAREHAAEQAVALDRLDIARELHDVVAHHVSVMGVQAGAARRVLTSDPATAASALELVERSARSAVEELHGLLTTLRGTEPDGDSGASTHGVAQLSDLVDETTRAGTPATLTVVGEPHPLTPLVENTIYRVAQEALTNVRKHAGVGATVDVRLRYVPGEVELEVADTGVGHSLGSRGGLGQLGMRERTTAVGGTLEVGPRARGGYVVRARVPVTVAS